MEETERSPDLGPVTTGGRITEGGKLNSPDLKALDMRDIRSYLESIGILTGPERALHPDMLKPRPMYDIDRPVSPKNPSAHPRSRESSPAPTWRSPSPSSRSGFIQIRPKSAGTRGQGVYVPKQTTTLMQLKASSSNSPRSAEPYDEVTRPNTAGSGRRSRGLNKQAHMKAYTPSTRTLMDLGFSPYWGNEVSKSHRPALPVGCIAPRKLNRKNPIVEVPPSLREIKEMMPRQWSDILSKIDDNPLRDQIDEDLRAYYDEKTRELHQSLRDWSGELEQRKQIYNSSAAVSPPRKKDLKRQSSPKNIKLSVIEGETPSVSPVPESKTKPGNRNSVIWSPSLYEKGTSVPNIATLSDSYDKLTEEQDVGADEDDVHSDPDEELAPYMEATFVLKWFNHDVVNMLCSQLASGERPAQLSMKRRRSSMPPQRPLLSRRGTSVIRIQPKSGGLPGISNFNEREDEITKIEPELFTHERRLTRSPSRLGLSGGAIYGQASPSSRASLVDVHSPVKYWG